MEFGSVVRRASDLTAQTAGVGADRLLPVSADLAALFPEPGLRRGATVAVQAGQAPGATSLMLALLAHASAAGSWCAVVGVPELGLVAASETGMVLDRLALVPYPGTHWAKVVATLLDGFDIVVAAAAGSTASASERMQISARARQHQAVFMPFQPQPGAGGDPVWEGADITLRTERSMWHGLGQGAGRLRGRELTVTANGRGWAARPRRATLWLPRPAGLGAPQLVARTGSATVQESSSGRPRLSVVR